MISTKKRNVKQQSEQQMLLSANMTSSLVSNTSSCIRIFSLLLCLLFPLSVQAESFDWKLWNHMLRQYMHTETVASIQAELIDYRALKQDPDFYRIASALKSYDPSGLDNNDRKAFYINSYNYFAAKLVVEHWPVQSIQDIGIFFWPVWKRTAGYINGQKITLKQIEHTILRPMGDPRIHFAINCASLSCPDLRNEAYEAQRLDAQLDEQSKRFVHNLGKGVQSHGGKLRVSAIFDWYEEDFTAIGGVVAFIRQYRELPSPITNIEYMPYNWHLNATNTRLEK